MPFNTLNVPSFFAGVATVLTILVVGFGGGVMMSGVLSDTSRKPNKIERQAASDTKPESKPASAPVTSTVTPVTPAAPVAVTEPAATKPAQGEAAAAEAVSNPTPAAAQPVQPDSQRATQAQPAAPVQAQAAPQPQTQSAAPQPQTTGQPPSLGPQKSVSLAQPPQEQQFDPSQLSRRDQARYWREQRRQERAQHREERRKQYSERRQQEQVRREEMRPAVQRMRPRDLDDDDDAPRVVPAQPRRLFDGLFGAPRDDD